MMKILIFDTNVASLNMGDEIIMNAIRRELRFMFPQAHLVNTPTHEIISRYSMRLNRVARYSVVGGTNLLRNSMFKLRKRGQWRLSLFDALQLSDLIMMGVGWRAYQHGKINTRTRFLLRKMLHKSKLHSVRDQYTKEKLQSIGIYNVVNTGCPTAWNLTSRLCENIPWEKADTVVFTLTDYSPDRKRDKAFVQLLTKHYKNCYFWPQGGWDLGYIKSLELDGFEVIQPSLVAYEEFLGETFDVDYVGTRLHAGIQALQAKRRSIILSIDNRAAEMHKDINLPIVPRGDFKALADKIVGAWNTDIHINQSAIDQWREQCWLPEHGGGMV